MVKTLVLGEPDAEAVIDALYDYLEKMLDKDNGGACPELKYHNTACRIWDILEKLGE